MPDRAAHLASDIVLVGGVGSGQVTKLCNNMLTAIITTALGEVLVTGVKSGVELEPLAAALGAGRPARSCSSATCRTPCSPRRATRASRWR